MFAPTTIPGGLVIPPPRVSRVSRASQVGEDLSFDGPGGIGIYSHQ